MLQQSLDSCLCSARAASPQRHRCRLNWQPSISQPIVAKKHQFRQELYPDQRNRSPSRSCLSRKNLRPLHLASGPNRQSGNWSHLPPTLQCLLGRLTIHIRRGRHMRGQCTAILQPTTGRLRHREVFHQCSYFRTIIEHRHHVASYQEGLAICFVDARQVEEIIVYTGLGTFGEEAGDEVALLVQPAPAADLRTSADGESPKPVDTIAVRTTKHIIVG